MQLICGGYRRRKPRSWTRGWRQGDRAEAAGHRGEQGDFRKGLFELGLGMVQN